MFDIWTKSDKKYARFNSFNATCSFLFYDWNNLWHNLCVLLSSFTKEVIQETITVEIFDKMNSYNEMCCILYIDDILFQKFLTLSVSEHIIRCEKFLTPSVREYAIRHRIIHRAKHNP